MMQDSAILTGISSEDYLARFSHEFYERVEGTVIKMSPVTATHDKLVRYLMRLLETYFDLTHLGEIRAAPFVMWLAQIDVQREPDIQIILKTNPGELTETYMNGPADICIEVVSPESVKRDRGDKFEEYERGRVPEYWIVDPIHTECRFYRLNEQGHYTPHIEDQDGLYRTPVLPQLTLHVPTLWHESLPGPVAVVQAVQGMLKA